MDPIIIPMPTGAVTFELTPRGPRSPGVYNIHAAHHRPSQKLPSADALVGMQFTVGDNPDFYPIGYARTIQRELNKKAG